MTRNYFVGEEEYFIFKKGSTYYVTDEYSEVVYSGTYQQCMCWFDYEYILQLEAVAY